MKWQATLIDRLLRNGDADGGCGYRPATSGCAEPTAMCAMALAAHQVQSRRLVDGLTWLSSLQRLDGSVPISPNMTFPCWTTSLAVLAWLTAQDDEGVRFGPNAAKAVGWLIKTHGRGVPNDRSLFGHDTTLEGWPWVDGTHSWVEPTAYAILALKTAGKADHPRVREGVHVLTDRALPQGGWNYGNTRVLKNTLRPFPATTGIVLTALADEPPDTQCVDASVAYLRNELQRVRSSMSLAWAMIGLSALNACPTDAQDRLDRCATRSVQAEPNALHDALLLLADARWNPATITNTSGKRAANG